jgi:uncharacterized protein
MAASMHLLPLPELATAFGQRLRVAGLAAGPERCARFADALEVTQPVARRRLYHAARAVFVTDRAQVVIFDRVFGEVFGRAAVSEPPTAETELEQRMDSEPTEATGAAGTDAELSPDVVRTVSHPAQQPASQPGESELPVPLLASSEEVLADKRFDALDPAELAALARLMARLRVDTPLRRTRRYQHLHHGRRIDLRRTLRGSLRSGGDPIKLRRRERRLLPRRLVLLCDISGSMEPYARVYLQFLVCAIGAGPRAEAFLFATRLTRVTRALAARDPNRAFRQAAAAAPDWSSGTRIGDALKSFNDRHGRRGMARGAVVVILSDGWERGDPSAVSREMERLSRLAHRIVWVNPRAAARSFSPRTGGMAAALPYCDALLSGESLTALQAVVHALADGAATPDTTPSLAAPTDASAGDEEPWASATPVPGSSVAMPSGYGPKRGHTTPGWGLGR